MAIDTKKSGKWEVWSNSDYYFRDKLTLQKRINDVIKKNIPKHFIVYVPVAFCMHFPKNEPIIDFSYFKFFSLRFHPCYCSLTIFIF